MTTLHAMIVHLFFFSTLSITYFSLTITINTIMIVDSATQPKRLVARLLHYDSLFHNPKNTIEDHAERIINTSVSRFIYLSQTAFQPNDVEATLHSSMAYDHIAFYVSFAIGQPPRPQFALMDTGSDIIWVNCHVTSYNPSESSTFAVLPCNDNYDCNSCSPSNECNYITKYRSGHVSTGIIATEKFTFIASDEGESVVNDVAFGCSTQTRIFESSNITGIFGLSNHRSTFSLVEQLGSKFSYCVGSLYDSNYTYNKLIIGEGEISEGDSTPLIVDQFYYIIFEGISVGEKRLDIDLNVFKKTIRGNNQVIIDTGTPLSWLFTSVYEILRDEIAHLADGLLTRYYYKDEKRFCYYGTVSDDLRGFPSMTLHFANGADLVLDTRSMFHMINPSAFCLTFVPSEEATIIGMIAQQNYNVAYDLVQQKLYLQRIECDLLEID